MSEQHKSGFISILGRPNAGKSTLLNAFVGAKVAIVADKPQTTRTAIQGVVTTDNAQLVFLDTPGIHKSDSLINKRMMDTVREALNERDLVLYLADATKPFSEQDKQALDLLRKTEAPAFFVLNKIDAVKDKRELLPLFDQYQQHYEFAEYYPISAKTGEGLDKLRDAIVARLPEGPAYFPADHITDQPERFLAAEFIREKALLLTRDEVPHSVAVTIEGWEETPKLTRIFATIVVERDGQKGILIGAKGSMLKKIGTQAREEMERLFNVHIYLDLRVKVQENWREKPAFLQALDWRTMAGNDES